MCFVVNVMGELLECQGCQVDCCVEQVYCVLVGLGVYGGVGVGVEVVVGGVEQYVVIYQVVVGVWVDGEDQVLVEYMDCLVGEIEQQYVENQCCQ